MSKPKTEKPKTLQEQIAEKRAARGVNKHKEDIFYGNKVPKTQLTTNIKPTKPISKEMQDALAEPPTTSIEDLVRDNVDVQPDLQEDTGEDKDEKLMNQLKEIDPNFTIQSMDDYETSHGFSTSALQEADDILNGIPVSNVSKGRSLPLRQYETNTPNFDIEIFKILLTHDWEKIFTSDKLKLHREMIVTTIAKSDTLLDEFTAYVGDYEGEALILDKVMSILLTKI